MKKYQARPDVTLPPLISHTPPETLYPKPKKPKPDHSDRPWRVDYELIYDDGISQFSRYYRTRFGAKLSAFFEGHFPKSWGGTAILVRQHEN